MAGTLVRAMGFTPTGSVGPAYATAEPEKYIEKARARGLPVDNSCDMTSMPFAMMECGDLPKEDLLRRTDLEEETIEDILKVLKQEFE